MVPRNTTGIAAHWAGRTPDRRLPTDVGVVSMGDARGQHREPSAARHRPAATWWLDIQARVALAAGNTPPDLVHVNKHVAPLVRVGEPTGGGGLGTVGGLGEAAGELPVATELEVRGWVRLAAWVVPRVARGTLQGGWTTG